MWSPTKNEKLRKVAGKKQKVDKWRSGVAAADMRIKRKSKNNLRAKLL